MKTKTLFLFLIAFSLFYCFDSFQLFAKKEKHYERKQKIRKVRLPEFVRNTFTTFTKVGSAKLEHVTVSDKAVITGPTTIKNSTINTLVLTGPLDASNTTFYSATITGPVSLDTCTIKDNFFVTGSMKAFESKFNRVDVTGPVSFKNCTFSGGLKITGTLEALHSTLHDIDITTNSKITFDHSSAHTIIIRENKSDSWLFGFMVNQKKNKQIVEVYKRKELH